MKPRSCKSFQALASEYVIETKRWVGLLEDSHNKVFGPPASYYVLVLLNMFPVYLMIMYKVMYKVMYIVPAPERLLVVSPMGLEIRNHQLRIKIHVL